jgi:hypothetical protein
MPHLTIHIPNRPTHSIHILSRNHPLIPTHGISRYPIHKARRILFLQDFQLRAIILIRDTNESEGLFTYPQATTDATFSMTEKGSTGATSKLTALDIVGFYLIGQRQVDHEAYKARQSVRDEKAIQGSIKQVEDDIAVLKREIELRESQTSILTQTPKEPDDLDVDFSLHAAKKEQETGESDILVTFTYKN